MGRKRRTVENGTPRVLREFVCLAHGPFEGYEEVCPLGCTTVERQFRTPFSIGAKAKNIDRTLQNLADDYGMTDMRNDMGSVMESMKRGQHDFQPTWGAMPQVKPGEGGHAVQGVLNGAPPSSVVQDFRDSGVLRPPVPKLDYRPDMTPIPKE
jgi:hypothetical protein